MVFSNLKGIMDIIICNIIKGNIIITCPDLFITVFILSYYMWQSASVSLHGFLYKYRSVLCMSWLLGIHFWVYRSSIKHSLPALSKDENCIIYVFAKKLHPSCFSKYFLWLDHEIYISSHWKFLSFIIRPVINVWILQRLLNIFWHLFINF